MDAHYLDAAKRVPVGRVARRPVRRPRRFPHLRGRLITARPSLRGACRAYGRLVAVALLLAGCARRRARPRAPRHHVSAVVAPFGPRPPRARGRRGARARPSDATADRSPHARGAGAREGARHADVDRGSVTSSVDPLITQGPPRWPCAIDGYRVSNVVQVRVRDLAAVGRILDAVIAAGANTLPSLQFTVNDRSGPESRARVLAVRAAAAKASQMAAAAGVRLGELVLLGEGGGVRPVLQQARYTLNAPGPVEPGQLEVEVTVGSYLIEKYGGSVSLRKVGWPAAASAIE